jgi:hypothetical protein
VEQQNEPLSNHHFWLLWQPALRKTFASGDVAKDSGQVPVNFVCGGRKYIRLKSAWHRGTAAMSFVNSFVKFWVLT